MYLYGGEKKLCYFDYSNTRLVQFFNGPVDEWTRIETPFEKLYHFAQFFQWSFTTKHRPAISLDEFMFI